MGILIILLIVLGSVLYLNLSTSKKEYYMTYYKVKTHEEDQLSQFDYLMGYKNSVNINDPPKLKTSIEGRYLAIVNTGRTTINITDISIFVSENKFIPINPIKPDVYRANIVYPQIYQPNFAFTNIGTYNGEIEPNSIALIPVTNKYLYSMRFRCDKSVKKISLLIFNPPDDKFYQDSVYTKFTSFNQINLQLTNPIVVIDFE